MAELIKSSSAEAESESSMMTAQGGVMQSAATLTIGFTNLTAIDNLQSVNTMMSACNENYKNLLKSHAESIAKLGREFSELDKELADKMGVTKG